MAELSELTKDELIREVERLRTLVERHDLQPLSAAEIQARFKTGQLMSATITNGRRPARSIKTRG